MDNKINLNRYISAILMVAMWVGLLWSRALLSLSLGIWILHALWMYGAEGLREWRESLWLKGLSLLFFLPLLSGLWSNDLQQWMGIMQIKLPLLFLPFCVPAFRALDLDVRKALLWVLVILLLVSMAQSLWWIYDAGGRNYLSGAVMRVPMGDDHVRYAWVLVVVYAWVLAYGLRGELKPRWLILLVLVIFAVFIHMMASKTGVLGFYVVTEIFIWHYLAKKYRWMALTVILLLPVLAWFLFPSFQERVKFVRWDFQQYSRGKYVEGLNDAPRVLSWRAAREIIKDNPGKGLGAGDARMAVNQWYAKRAPFLKPYERLLPANQFLVYGIYGGLVCLVLAACILLVPLFIRFTVPHPLWTAFHLVAIAGFMYEIALEMQYGVFVYTYFTLLFFTEVKRKNYF